MVLRQPVAQARRQQQLLLTITPDEVLSHTQIVPTDTDRPYGLCNSHHAKEQRGRRRRIALISSRHYLGFVLDRVTQSPTQVDGESLRASWSGLLKLQL
jgi:hypothetical protein